MRGSSKSQVLSSMGNPVEIRYGTDWYYGNSNVEFSSSSASGVVKSWDNAGGNLELEGVETWNYSGGSLEL